MATADKITLNLDTVERDEDEVVDPFVVSIAGRAITMTDPAEIDWQDLLEIEQPQQFLRHCLNTEDRKHLAAQRIPGWKMGKLIDAYMSHYRMDELMEKARRQQRLRSV